MSASAASGHQCAKSQVADILSELEETGSEYKRQLQEMLAAENLCTIFQLSVLTRGDYGRLCTKYGIPSGVLQQLHGEVSARQLKESSTLADVLLNAAEGLNVTDDSINSMVEGLKKFGIHNVRELYRHSRTDLLAAGLSLGMAVSIQLSFYFSHLVDERAESVITSSALLDLDFDLANLDQAHCGDAGCFGTPDSSAETPASLIQPKNTSGGLFGTQGGLAGASLATMRKRSIEIRTQNAASNELLVSPASECEVRYIVSFSFLSAHGLPKRKMMDCSPYLKASLNGVNYTTKHKPRTGSPVWDEFWVVRNVPASSTLILEVWHRSLTMSNQLMGTASITLGPHKLEELLTGVVRETVYLKGQKQTAKGELLLEMSAVEAQPNPALMKVGSFGGNRMHIHSSGLVGTLAATSSNKPFTADTFNCYEIRLFHVPAIFGDHVQPWNRNYEAAKKIFSEGPVCAAVRRAIHVQHQSLYREGLFRSVALDLFSGADFLKAINNGYRAGIPREYTYVLLDHTFNFSETGAALKDMVSKHASHSNCARSVRYAGEFHIRQNEETQRWQLVIDNNSGTFAPDKQYLGLLKEAMELNFTGLDVVVYDREDPKLSESLAQLRAEASEANAHAPVGAVEGALEWLKTGMRMNDTQSSN